MMPRYVNAKHLKTSSVTIMVIVRKACRAFVHCCRSIFCPKWCGQRVRSSMSSSIRQQEEGYLLFRSAFCRQATKCGANLDSETMVNWQRRLRERVDTSQGQISPERELAFFRGYQSWLNRNPYLQQVDYTNPPSWVFKMYSSFVGLPLRSDENPKESEEQTDDREQQVIVDVSCRPRVKTSPFTCSADFLRIFCTDHGGSADRSLDDVEDPPSIQSPDGAASSITVKSHRW